MRFVLLAALLAVPRIAAADLAGDIKALIEDLPARETGGANPVFSFSNAHVFWRGKDNTSNQPSFAASGVDIQKLVVATAKDGKTAWFSADVKGVAHGGDCAPELCGKNPFPPLHVTGLVEQTRRGWSWIAWHIAEPVGRKEQAQLLQERTVPDALPRSIEGAEGVVALFETTILESKTLAGTVSDRKDVVLYGSESGERYVGGAKVKAQLTKWQLGFTVRDGVQAGISASKRIAWVAANVDARSVKRPGETPTQYRVLFLYEQAGAAWKLVQLHFSVDTFTSK